MQRKVEELFVESGEEESSTATHEVLPQQEVEAEAMRLVAAGRTVAVAMLVVVVKSKEAVEATKVEVMKEMGKVKAVVVKEMGTVKAVLVKEMGKVKAVLVKEMEKVVMVVVVKGKRFERGEKVEVKKTRKE